MVLYHSFVPNNFASYFKINSHGMGTRNASFLILLPKIHTEYARNYFYYMGAKTYNDLEFQLTLERYPTLTALLTWLRVFSIRNFQCHNI